VTRIPEEYETQPELIKKVDKQAQERHEEIVSALNLAFENHIKTVEEKSIQLSKINVETLADILLEYPIILKPMLILTCVFGSRALQRDLGLKSIDTYNPRLTRELALRISEYLKPLLPSSVTLSAMVQLDWTEFMDKEIRASKGRWETRVLQTISVAYGLPFKKRKIVLNGEEYEIDAATPLVGDIIMAVDVKRLEAERDLHKRCDEIVRKASALKETHKNAKFVAVIYYPFDKNDIRNRLSNSDIDKVVFADNSPSSIEIAALEIKKSTSLAQ
jgi:phosphoribosylpyrophosphate synthetase